MAESNDADEVIDYSPWKHPKAQRWFKELLEETHLPLMIEDALEKPDAELSRGESRLFLSLMIMLGRKGIWPENRESLFRTVIRKTVIVMTRKQGRSDKPLTLSEHKVHAKVNSAMDGELEILRRRIGMSNRKTALSPPKSWGRFWR